VAEAMMAPGLYSRSLEARCAPPSTPRRSDGVVKLNVDAFTGAAPKADDVTMLAGAWPAAG
jgi:hypothetical protein